MFRRDQIVAILVTASTHFPAIATSELEPVIVTAARTAQTVNETLSAVTVITREEIEESSAHSLPELMAGATGIDIKTSGGYGKASSVFIRGTESKHVLLLIDGVRFHDAIDVNGRANIQFLPLDIIERIEIVRGPKASLYGSDAVGGVIQVFTKPDHDYHYANIGFGTEETQSLSAGFSGSKAGTQYSLRASRFSTEGISAKSNNEESDGYNNNSIAIQIEHALPSNRSIGISLLQSRGETEFDNCYAPYYDDCINDFEQLAINSNWSQQIHEQWDIDIDIGKSDHLRISNANGKYHATSSTISILNKVDWNSGQQLLSGIDYIYDEALETRGTSINWNRESIALFGNFTQYLDSERQLSIGLRQEKNQNFGNHLTGDIAYEQPVNKSILLRLSYGEAFRAPSLYELLDPTSGTSTLQPEQSRSIEINLSGEFSDRTQWSASLFNTKLDDMIIYDSGSFKYQQLSKAEIDGLEIELKTTVKDWKLSPSITLLNPVDRIHHTQLISRAKQTLKLQAQRNIGKGKISLNWLTQSYRNSYKWNDPNGIYTAGYGKLDASINYPWMKNVTLHAKIGNLFDKQYQINNGYNTEGRNAFLSLNYRM